MNNPKPRKPEPFYIPRCEEYEKLYILEKRRDDIIHECSKEWAKIASASLGDVDYWKEVIPQVLYDTVQSFGKSTAYIVAAAILANADRD